MRILVITNLYPPYYVGGYELGCRDVVDGLKARSHQVGVLASSYGLGKPQCDGEVYRWMEADLSRKNYSRLEYGARHVRREIKNVKALRRLCALFKPDVVYIWNLANVSLSVVHTAQQLGLPTCYYVFDNWLSIWEKGDRWYHWWSEAANQPLQRFGKQALSRFLDEIGLRTRVAFSDMKHVQFASRYLKQVALKTGKPVADARVIPWGIDINRYPYQEVSRSPRRLLYTGQIVPHKGVHTIIEALGIIVQKHRKESVRLTLVGGTTIPDYEARVRRLVSSLGLESHVHFTGFLPRESLPSVYQEHDILLFPSIWDEPFGIVLLEAMSSGLAAVGTATGGSSEILQDEVNALVFPKESAEACAIQVLRLMDDRRLFEAIRESGRCTVEAKFRFDSMMDKIEKALQESIA
jgi:glycosyltransferase involved in cell wall biosynthesis